MLYAYRYMFTDSNQTYVHTNQTPFNTNQTHFNMKGFVRGLRRFEAQGKSEMASISHV